MEKKIKAKVGVVFVDGVGVRSQSFFKDLKSEEMSLLIINLEYLLDELKKEFHKKFTFKDV